MQPDALQSWRPTSVLTVQVLAEVLKRYLHERHRYGGHGYATLHRKTGHQPT